MAVIVYVLFSFITFSGMIILLERGVCARTFAVESDVIRNIKLPSMNALLLSILGLFAKEKEYRVEKIRIRIDFFMVML